MRLNMLEIRPQILDSVASGMNVLALPVPVVTSVATTPPCGGPIAVTIPVAGVLSDSAQGYPCRAEILLSGLRVWRERTARTSSPVRR